jgi:ribosomal-protein-alanine N-acetyltransferase
MRNIGPYTIRPMTTGDIPAVVTIDRLSFPTPWPASSYMYELTRNSRSFYYVLVRAAEPELRSQRRPLQTWFRDLLGTTDEGRVIGYVGLRLEPRGSHVSTLAVHPDQRGRGLGELLLLTAIGRTLELGLANVTLEVRASNQVAQRLYRKYGFRSTGMHRGYYRDGEDAWLMEADLSEPGFEACLAQRRASVEQRLGTRAEQVGQYEPDHL